MTDIYIVVAHGIWTRKVRGVFTDEQTATRYAIEDERNSDGHHDWKVWRAQLDVPSPHPEGGMSDAEGDLFHADFDLGEMVFAVPTATPAEREARSPYTDLDRTI